MLEMGKGFSFVGKQVAIKVDDKDYYIDLLLYHLKLHCYVALELKIGDFKPEYAGKMNFYLSTIDKNYKTSMDNLSIGLILCKNKNKVTVEYALQDVNKPMGVAAYQITTAIPQDLQGQLPSIEALEQELKKEVPFAKSNQKKREELEKLITELSPKEFTGEKSMPALNELWHDMIFNLKTAIEKACEPEMQLFEHIWVTRFIDGSNAEGILDHFQNLNINVKEIGLLLSMETFKSAGSKAFSVEKYLSIKLNSTCYTISHKASNWITKDYHEKLNAQELEEISGRLVNLALGAINKKIKQIIK